MAKVQIGLPRIGAAAAVTGREATRPRGLGFTGSLAWAMARYRRLVLALWVALMAAGLPLAIQLEQRLTSAGWDVAGSESLAARQLLEREFAFAYPQNLILVFHHPTLRTEDAAYRAQVDAAVGALAGQPYVKDVYTFYGTGNPRLASADGHSTWALVGLAASADEATVAAPDLIARVLAARRAGFQVDVTGQPAMWADFNRTNKQAMLDGEKYAWPAVLLILLVAFGSAVAAGIPMFLTIVALGVTMGVLYLISFLMPLSIWVMNFVVMVGFGVGIDYCLFIVSRFRDELRRQSSIAAAVAVTMDTTGKSVLFSGITVLISLAPLALVPVAVFQSMALGLVLTVAAVLTVCLTFLPALLALLGPRVDRLRVPRLRLGDGAAFWGRWAKIVMRRPLAFALACAAILLALASPAIDLRLGMPGITILSSDTTARAGFERLKADFGAGALAPINVVVRFDGKVWEPEALETIYRLSDAIYRDEEVASLESLAAPGAGMTLDELRAVYGGGLDGVPDPRLRAAAPFLVNVDRGQDTTVLRVYAKDPPESRAAQELVGRLRDTIIPSVGHMPGRVLVGGVAAETLDLTNAQVSIVPLAIGTVLALTFALLLVFLRSVVLPLKAIVMNVLTVLALYGVLVVIFQKGVGASLIGFESQGFVNAWAPLFFFALVFGLSMDYEMFLLGTFKERFEATRSNEESISWALSRTGRPITMAAAVMVVVFASFALAGTLPPKEMGTGLAAAILLDATLVRMVLVPATMRLMGPANWWLPRPLARLLPKVGLSH